MLNQSFRNHYSGDGKQKSREAEQQPFFFLFKNLVTFFFSCLLIALSHQPNVAFAVDRISNRDGRLLLCKLDVGEKYKQGNKAKQWIYLSLAKGSRSWLHVHTLLP